MINNALVYGYSNARIRALSGQLIDHGTMERMIRADSVESAVAVLSDSSYAPELSELSLTHKGAAMADYAIVKHFANTCKKILNMTPQSSKAAVEALLTRWDVEDIKTILIGKSHGMRLEEISRLLMEAGSLNSAEYALLLRGEGVSGAVKYMGDSLFGRALMPHLIEYEHNQELSPLLEELDRIYLLRLEEAIRETDDRLVKSLLMVDADAKNIMTILRARLDGPADADRIKKMLVAAGNLRAAELETLLTSKDWRPILSRFGGFNLTDAFEAFDSDNSLTHVEQSLQQTIMLHAFRAFRMSVMSLGVIVGFLYVKEDELRKLQKIIHGKEYGLTGDEIRKSVYGVG